MVVRARSRRSEASASSRVAGVLLAALAGCFNPSGSDPTGPGTTDATATAATGGSTTATSTGSSGEPTTTAPLTSTAPATDGSTAAAGCGSDGECPPETPNCESGECLGCDDDDGCTAAAPFCDGGTCRGCLYHEECSKACDIAENECFPEDTLEYLVVPSGNCGLCGDGYPCCSIEQALETAAGKSNKYVRISLESMGVDGVSPTIDQTYPDKVIAIVGQGQNPIVGPATGPAFELSQPGPDMRVYLWRLRFAGTMLSSGLRCTGGRLWLDRVVVDGFSTTPGLSIFGCAAQVRRSTIVANMGAITVIDGPLVLRDAVLGGSPGPVPELTLGTGSELDARYATVVDEVGGMGGLMACDATSPIAFENSIVVSTAEANTVTTCVVAAKRSVLSPAIPPQPEGDNVFATFQDFAFKPGYRLMTIGGPAANVARWHTGYSPTDIDGTARPTVDDTPDYAGAHIPFE